MNPKVRNLLTLFGVALAISIVVGLAVIGIVWLVHVYIPDFYELWYGIPMACIFIILLSLASGLFVFIIKKIGVEI